MISTTLFGKAFGKVVLALYIAACVFLGYLGTRRDTLTNREIGESLRANGESLRANDARIEERQGQVIGKLDTIIKAIVPSTQP
jgi:hypothetical protein